MIIAAPFTVIRTWRPSKCPTADEWMEKLWYMYTVGYYLAPEGTKLGHLYRCGWA